MKVNMLTTIIYNTNMSSLVYVNKDFIDWNMTLNDFLMLFHLWLQMMDKIWHLTPSTCIITPIYRWET